MNDQLDMLGPQLDEHGRTNWNCPGCNCSCADDEVTPADVLRDGLCVFCRQRRLGVDKSVRGDELRELWEEVAQGGAS